MFGPGAESEALRGAVVVLPAVTHANVGELAVDVLVASLRPQPLGALESHNMLPAVGNDAYDSGSSSGGGVPPGGEGGAGAAGPGPGSQQQQQQAGVLSTALELFALQGRQLVLLQQRAPPCVGRQRAFAEELAGWLAGRGAAAVVALCGLDAGMRRDGQLEGPPLRYMCSSEALRARLQSAPSGCLPPPLEPELEAEERAAHGLLPPWPLLAACGAAGLPCVALGCWAAEGDNAAEGVALAAAALRVLAGVQLGEGKEGGQGAQGGVLGGEGAVAELVAGGLRTPRSWVGLYGRSFPEEIF